MQEVSSGSPTETAHQVFLVLIIENDVYYENPTVCDKMLSHSEAHVWRAVGSR